MRTNKILFLLSFLILGIYGMSIAGQRRIPQGRTGDLHSADYGGVNYSTIAFSSSLTSLFVGEGSFVGIICSSVPTAQAGETAYYSVHDTTSSVNTNEVLRVYFATAAPSGAAQQFGFISEPPKPVRVRYGLGVKLNIATLNLCTPLWTKFDD